MTVAETRGWAVQSVGGWTVTALVVLLATWCVISRKKKKHTPEPVLTEQALAAWNPAPLVEEDVTCETPPLVGKLHEAGLNIGAFSFLALDGDEVIKQHTIDAVRKYGVGSCGPRGFYGTIDVHLELEQKLADFLKVEETCVYSYGFATVASAIPSYAKKPDIIFADEGVWAAIQQGLDASRSTVRYFRHNDTGHLESLLAAAAEARELHPKRRAFLVAEAVYLNTGELCPLAELVRLARRYKLRIILDESLSIGVLGKTGRGLTELLGVPRHEIDLSVGSLEHSFASTGGFCAGTSFIVEHQRLSGLGYCFSASLPPPLARAAISALQIVESRPEMIGELNSVSQELHDAVNKLRHWRARGQPLSPVQHVCLRTDLPPDQQHERLRAIASDLHERGLEVAVAAYVAGRERVPPPPSLRLAASRRLTAQHIALLAAALDEAAADALA